MKRRQWLVSGSVFYLVAVLFFILARGWEPFMLLPSPLNYTTGQLMIYTVASLKHAIFGGFAILCVAFGSACFFCAGLSD